MKDLIDEEDQPRGCLVELVVVPQPLLRLTLEMFQFHLLLFVDVVVLLIHLSDLTFLSNQTKPSGVALSTQQNNCTFSSFFGWFIEEITIHSVVAEMTCNRWLKVSQTTKFDFRSKHIPLGL